VDHAGVAGPLTHLVFLLASAHPRGIRVDHERTDSLVASGAVEGREHREAIGVASIRDPALGAVQHVVIAVLLGQQLKPRHVRAGGRLREAEGDQPELPGEMGQPLLALGVAAPQQDRRHSQVVGHDRGGHAAATSGQLLHHEHRVEQGETRAAVLRRDGAARQTQIPGLANDLHRELGALIELGRDRDDLLVGEAPGRFLKRQLLVAKLEIHL
jgi:hypothetical protein